MVIKKTKSEGYNGGEDKDNVQWTFSGALLYSITVITTIGKFLSFLKVTFFQMMIVLLAKKLNFCFWIAHSRLMIFSIEKAKNLTKICEPK